MAWVFICFVYVRACCFFKIPIINAHAPKGKQKDERVVQ